MDSFAVLGQPMPVSPSTNPIRGMSQPTKKYGAKVMGDRPKQLATKAPEAPQGTRGC